LPLELREGLEHLLADEERRWALYDHPRRIEFVARALTEMLGERGTTAGRGPPIRTRLRCESSR
jgi:hypothetical protein